MKTDQMAHLGAVITVEQKKRLIALAAKSNVSLSHYLRAVIDHAIKENLQFQIERSMIVSLKTK